MPLTFEDGSGIISKPLNHKTSWTATELFESCIL